MEQLVIVFIKNPIKGKVKTRLAATIGEDAALKVYCDLLKHTLEVTKDLACDKVVYYSDYIPEKDEWSQAGFRQALQSGSDLGERMLEAFEDGFRSQYSAIVIIGSDCLELNMEHLVNALSLLKNYRVVIGPAHDGGYYLLGMTQLFKMLFQNKQWSTETVFDSTVQDLRQARIRYSLLPRLADIDNEADLKGYKFTQP